jgi:hypothetical protein
MASNAGRRGDRSNRRRFVAGAQMANAECDYMPTEVTECRPWFWQAIEPIYQFAVERLFRDVASSIERVKRICEAIV